MIELLLKKNQKKYVEDKFYLIKKGKILTKDIFPNGKYVVNENYLKKGDIIGNLLNFYNLKDENIEKNSELEIKALENSILEEINFSLNKIDIVGNVMEQLTRKVRSRLIFHKYSKEGYILAAMLSYGGEEGVIKKSDITYEDFNMSRSQFYLIFSKLKKDNFFTLENNSYILNKDKIYEYLNKD